MNPEPKIHVARRKLSPRLRKWLIGFGAFVVVLVGFLWFIGVLGGNVREVDPGQFYRSAQLTDNTLRTALTQHHIASVVDLRGSDVGAPYYQSEIGVCQSMGVQHRDVNLSAQRLPPPAEIDKLVRDYDELPRPIMVHCKAGSDRTGLATTLFDAMYEHIPLDQAEARDLTWRYGHFSFTRTHAMDEFFDLYRQTGRGLDLRTWIFKTYPSIYANLQRENASEVEPARLGE